MNVLIIEDDKELASQIQGTFLKYGFANRVDHIPSYAHYLKKSLSIHTFDIVLLDINLWKELNKNGFTILSHIRTINTDIPIIIISSHSWYSFLEEAFAKWAHDYMIKPFRNRELQIRIQRWFRNYIFSEYFCINKTLIYHNLVYDISAHEFYINSEKIQLSKGNKYLLSLFLIYREKLLRQYFLVEKIWWVSSKDREKNLRIKIMRLKEQLKPYGLHDWLQTFHWDGYMLKKISD